MVNHFNYTIGNTLNKRMKNFQLKHHLQKYITNKFLIYSIHPLEFYIADGIQRMDFSLKI